MQKDTLFHLQGRARARSRDKMTEIEADYELISAKLIDSEPNFMSDFTTVPVHLPHHSYTILIGKNLIQNAGFHSAPHLKGRTVAIISDENVATLHLETLQNALEQHKIKTVPIIIKAGEKSKSFAVLESVTRQILQAKLERNDLIIAFGGGVVGDLAGFAASIVLRGISFIQIPTSLLAQVDSSVGGKTGINTGEGKNLIGAFYQPQLVLADTDILSTLPAREFCAGYAEMLKYGLINNVHFFEFLEKNWHEVFARNSGLEEAIATSCRAKAEIVMRDEHERGERALLNLGHTFGHALEAFVNYESERLVHGEAVAIGMVLAHRFSAHLNLMRADDATRIENHLQNVGLPTKISDIAGSLPDAETLLNFMAQDKKVTDGKMNFILSKGIGQSFIARDISRETVQEFLTNKII